jgi:hypothetical protein
MLAASCDAVQLEKRRAIVWRRTWWALSARKGCKAWQIMLAVISLNSRSEGVKYEG